MIFKTFSRQCEINIFKLRIMDLFELSKANQKGFSKENKLNSKKNVPANAFLIHGTNSSDNSLNRTLKNKKTGHCRKTA